MTEVLIRMEGLDNIRGNAWNELLNTFSERDYYRNYGGYC